MKLFKEKVYRYIRNIQDYEFNTKGIGFKENTFFYFSKDNELKSKQTFSKLSPADERKVWNWLKRYQHILFNRNTDIQSVHIFKHTFIVNEQVISIDSDSHLDALNRYMYLHPMALG